MEREEIIFIDFLVMVLKNIVRFHYNMIQYNTVV